MKMKPALSITAIIILVLLASLLIFQLRATELTFLSVAGKDLNHEISYQLLTFLLALLILLFSILLGGKNVLAYFNLQNRKAQIAPAKFVGINPKEGENWLSAGISLTVIISLVTAVVVYLQVADGHTWKGSLFTPILLAPLFALVNAFNEEMIYRFSIATVFTEKGVNPNISALSSGIIFGFVHYWGTPGGILGVLMAGFLGWFLAKSIIENRGIFWALLIHFTQDVIIFFFKFSFQ